MFKWSKPPYTGQVFTQKSETIPDQAMTLRHILERYSRGLDLGGKNEEIWQDPNESSGIPLKKLDLVDLQTAGNDVKEVIGNYKAEQSAKKRAQTEKEIEDRVKAELEKRTQSTNTP